MNAALGQDPHGGTPAPPLGEAKLFSAAIITEIEEPMPTKLLNIPSFIFIISVLAGCSSLPPSDATSTAAVFLPTAEDAPRVAMLGHELDTKSLRCLEAANCEQVYFGRALVGLFENREAASANFRRVIDHNPVSPLANSSQMWLR